MVFSLLVPYLTSVVLYHLQLRHNFDVITNLKILRIITQINNNNFCQTFLAIIGDSYGFFLLHIPYLTSVVLYHLQLSYNFDFITNFKILKIIAQVNNNNF